MTTPLQDELFDIVIVGTGVVGCAMARRFTLEGARVLILEKSGDTLDGASKANSAILHTGFDAPPRGSQEQACITEGYADYLRIREKLNLPLLECGALVLAWTEQEGERLDGIKKDAISNGVNSVHLLSKQRVLEPEPGIADGIFAALEVPGEYVIDPWSAPHAYLLQALENGARMERHCELLGGQFDGAEWVSSTGYYGGHFAHDWLGIKASNRLAYLRVGEFHKMRDGKIVESYIYLDIPELMMAVNQWPLSHGPAATPGYTGFLPGPATGDGVVLITSDVAESEKSLTMVTDMLLKLNTPDQGWRPLRSAVGRRSRASGPTRAGWAG